MYRKSSTPCFEVSADKVVAAMAFQFEMALEPPSADTGATRVPARTGAAVAVPAGNASIRAAAATAAGPLRVGRCQRGVGGKEGCRTVRISHPQERRSPSSEAVLQRRTLLRSVCERKGDGHVSVKVVEHRRLGIPSVAGGRANGPPEDGLLRRSLSARQD